MTLVVRTRQGAVRGSLADDVHAFKGIPFVFDTLDKGADQIVGPLLGDHALRRGIQGGGRPATDAAQAVGRRALASATREEMP